MAYLPVAVPGALLSIGDIHAIMAEGSAVVSVDVMKGLALRAPRAETADEWMFIGLGDLVQESIRRV